MNLDDLLHNVIVDSSIDLKIKFIELSSEEDFYTYKFNFYQSFNIVGTMTLEKYGKIVNLHVFWINRDYRDLKLGNKFLRKVCEILNKDYLITLTAFPLDNNISLQDLIIFYTKNGFKQVSSIIDNSVYMEYDR